MASFVTLVVAFVVVAGGSAVYTASRLSHEIELMTVDCIPGLALAGRMESKIEAIERSILEHIAATNPTEMADAEQEIAQATGTLEKAMKEYEGTITMEEDRQIFVGMAALLRMLVTSFREDVMELSKADRAAEAAKAHWKRGLAAYRELRRVVGRESTEQ